MSNVVGQRSVVEIVSVLEKTGDRDVLECGGRSWGGCEARGEAETGRV